MLIYLMANLKEYGFKIQNSFHKGLWSNYVHEYSTLIRETHKRVLNIKNFRSAHSKKAICLNAPAHCLARSGPTLPAVSASSQPLFSEEQFCGVPEFTEEPCGTTPSFSSVTSSTGKLIPAQVLRPPSRPFSPNMRSLIGCWVRLRHERGWE